MLKSHDVQISQCSPEHGPTGNNESSTIWPEFKLDEKSGLMAGEISRTELTREDALHSIYEVPEADKTISSLDSRFSQNNFGKVLSILIDASDSAHETPAESEETELDLARECGTIGMARRTRTTLPIELKQTVRGVL